MNKKAYYLLVFICVVSFLLFIYLVFKSLTTPPPNLSNGDNKHYELESEPEKGEEISRLIDKTPYFGSYFSLTYNFDEGLFVVNIDPSNKSIGEKEFNEFLKQNGIPNKDYVVGLKTTMLPFSASATPGP